MTAVCVFRPNYMAAAVGNMGSCSNVRLRRATSISFLGLQKASLRLFQGALYILPFFLE